MKKWAVIYTTNYNETKIKVCHNEQHAKNYDKFLYRSCKAHQIIQGTDEELQAYAEKQHSYASNRPRVYRCNRYSKYARFTI